MKAARRREIALKAREYWARLKREEPSVWAEKVAGLRRIARERILSGKRMPIKADAISNADAKVSAGKKEPEEPGSPAQDLAGFEASPLERAQWDAAVGRRPEGVVLAHVSEIPINPRLVFARSDVCSRFEVLVGNNGRLWVEAPMWVRPSPDFAGYYEFVGELPKGRWDRCYAEKFL